MDPKGIAERLLEEELIEDCEVDDLAEMEVQTEESLLFEHTWLEESTGRKYNISLCKQGEIEFCPLDATLPSVVKRENEFWPCVSFDRDGLAFTWTFDRSRQKARWIRQISR